MKKLSLIVPAVALLATTSCTSRFGTDPGGQVEELERQAPVTPTPNPSGQIFDPTLNPNGFRGGFF